jgi:hypothetical protein
MLSSYVSLQFLPLCFLFYRQIAGAEKTVTIKMADLLQKKPKLVSFPSATGKDDPKFAKKVVVKQYLGRQVYQKKRASPDQ